MQYRAKVDFERRNNVKWVLVFEASAQIKTGFRSTATNYRNENPAFINSFQRLRHKRLSRIYNSRFSRRISRIG